MSNTYNNNNSNNGGQFGDTTLTKVFVGGLAWETPKEAMRQHFEKFGEILEAVIISDKLTGRSKGYGFVTFRDPEAAKKACEDATPIINGRRANCNLAALGARRPPRSSSATPPPQQPLSNGGSANGIRHVPAAAPPPAPVQWYYPAAAAGGAPAAAIHAHQHHQAIPFYGFSPAYIAADVTYNNKMGYNGGGYMNGGAYTQMYHPQVMMGATAANTLMPMSMYPFYYHHQQSHHPHHHHHHHQATMGLPAQMFPPTSAGPITAPLPIISKPPPSVCLAVE